MTSLLPPSGHGFHFVGVDNRTRKDFVFFVHVYYVNEMPSLPKRFLHQCLRERSQIPKGFQTKQTLQGGHGGPGRGHSKPAHREGQGLGRMREGVLVSCQCPPPQKGRGGVPGFPLTPRESGGGGGSLGEPDMGLKNPKRQQWAGVGLWLQSEGRAAAALTFRGK